MDKAKSASISLPQSYWEKLEIIASDDFSGNRTQAIKTFIDAYHRLKKITDLRKLENPIGELTTELLYHSDVEEYQNAIAHEAPGRPRREHELLPNLLHWTYKIIHNPDRTDMALITIGELREAMEATFVNAKTNPDYRLRDIYPMAYERIKAAKRRTHLKSVDEIPTEPIAHDPEIPNDEDGWKWISRDELRATLYDFIKAEDLVPEEQIERILDFVFDPSRDDTKIWLAAEDPARYNKKPPKNDSLPKPNGDTPRAI